MGGTDGHTLEVVVSRARYVASQLEKSVRIVGLATSLANAKDVGDWIGTSYHSLYNFPPDVRPVPLEIHFHAFDINHFSSRLLAMAKPTYNAIIGHSASKPAIVFVPSRKQAQLTAIDIITYAAAAGGDAQRFLHTSSDAMQPVLATIKEPALAQTLARGVGFLHSGLPKSDRDRVCALYRDGILGVLVCPHDLCWSTPGPAHLVVVMDTVYFEGREHRFVDYSITDVMQMVGLACRPLLDESGKCVILCHAPKKEYLKKLLHDPLPLESHLDHFLHDHLNAEIVTKTIENKQDAVDYLTWTFYYRRLSQNPNYYNMQGSTHRHLSDHLSELIETTIADLEESKCVSVEDEMDLSPLNLGMISSYYYIQYTTVELFASSLTAKTKIKGIMEILAAASEYARIPIRQQTEVAQMKRLSTHLPQALPESANFEDPAIKTNVLLQAHCSRQPLPTDLAGDLRFVLTDALKLIQALVDVISSQGWLRPALAAMELSQMVVQGLWDKDSPLLQIPHFTEEIVGRCKAHEPPVETVFDILEVDDDVRDALLQLPPEKLSDVALFCNSYPNVEVNFETSFDKEVAAGSMGAVMVSVKREVDEEEEDAGSLGKVVCPRYPFDRFEGWWLVLGDANTNSLLSIKRLAFGKSAKAKLEFSVPEDAGDYTLVLYLMCDSYMGCDQEYEIEMSVVPDDAAEEE